MESKKINQLATELSPALDDLTIIGDPTTGISRKITLSQMASLFTGTVEEYASLAAFPLVGAADTIYIALDTNILYRWSGSAYVELSPNIVSSLVFSDANGFDGTITLVGSVATLSITTALTLGSLPFIGASGALTQDNNNLFYDDTNNRLGIGTNAPTTPLDVFGSGIISRINGTSTNNGFLGFASAGSNKWSVGNVQSDHRFRIFSEANTAELVSLLQTGEFGIGIANPTTKLHLDGGASALIANLDANVSVAKSLSFRSDNSNRINLEVSGTESGSNAGADFFIRRYSDAGALIDTPLQITRSTGLITLATALAGLSASFSSTATASAFIPSGATVPTNGMYLSAANTLAFATNSTNRLIVTSGGNLEVRSAGQLIAYRSDNNRSGAFFADNLAVQITASTDPIRLTSPERIDFYTGATEKLRITLGGDLQLASGVATFTRSGKKIELNANSANANVDAEIEITSGMNLFFKLGGSERMRITSGGDVYIGDSANTIGNTRFYVKGEGTNPASRIWANTSTSTVYGLVVRHENTSNGAYIQFLTDGNVETGRIYDSSGTMQYASSSDLRLKTNIKPLKNALNSVLALNPCTFDMFRGENTTIKSAGLIAQEVYEIYPYVVGVGGDSEKTNPWSVDYGKLTPLLISAIQEQQAQIEELKALIK